MTNRHLLWALLIGIAAPSAAPTGPPPAFEEILKIDVHSHVFGVVPEVVEMMDRNRVRIVNVCVRGTDPQRPRRQEELAERQQAKYGRHRFPFASTFDLTRREDPDYADQVKRWLSASGGVDPPANGQAAELELRIHFLFPFARLPAEHHPADLDRPDAVQSR